MAEDAPVLRIVTPDTTPEEVAALVAVLAGIGGFGANHHLRQMAVFLNVPLLQQPEAYLGGAPVSGSNGFQTNSLGIPANGGTVTINPTGNFDHIVIRFDKIEGRDENEPLSATLLLRPTISHPDLANILTDDHREAMHLKLTRDDDGKPVDALHIHSYAPREITKEVEQEIWKELGVDEEVPESLGTIDAGVRSEPLAIAQLILLYHMFQARNSH